MKDIQEYGYGQEFRVNDNGALYPAYLSLEDLQTLAFKLATHLLGAIDYAEVKVAQTHDGKGLDWEITSFSEEPGDKSQVRLSRKYTLSLCPSWRACGCHDHWLSIMTPRCQYSERMELVMQRIVDAFLVEFAQKYKSKTGDWFVPQLDKHLRNRNWTNILTIGKRSFSQQTRKVDRRAKQIRADAKRRRKS